PAQENYEKAHQLAPNNPLSISGGVNSAIESHQLPLAKQWLDRADQNTTIAQNPQVMRERERYLSLTGRYQESAELGYKVLEKLPRDPEAPVYLAYDLLFLNRYDDAAKIVAQYKPILPKDKDLRLIAGYLDTHFDRLQDAVGDFTQALEIDPNVATAYMNRGFVLNDLEEPTKAAKDFQMALKLRQNYGEQHLGLASAEQNSGANSRVLMATGDALMTIGEHQAAMDRYARALDAPNSDRVGTRLALARLFSESGHPDQAQQQVSLGFAESRVGEANPI